ncbi:ABC transporter permease subunit [Paenibacillus oryzae]|nr:ABC transporter permease subunit [Paenibacillus oryzae]
MSGLAASERSVRPSSGLSRFAAMFGKELLELVRSLKLIWVPIVFIALGIMQPVTSYYMPVILEKAGNLPDGSVIEIPLPTGAQVMAETLAQFGSLGALVIVLVFMGTVSSERNSGAVSMILVKPVSPASYLVSKWGAMLLLSSLSLLAGYGAAWYYTGFLIEAVAFKAVLSSFLLYELWLLVLLTLTLLLSTALRSAAGAAFAALGAGAVLSLLSNLFPKYAGWLPGALPGFARQAVMGSLEWSSRFGACLVATVMLLAALVLLANILLRRAAAID